MPFTLRLPAQLDRALSQAADAERVPKAVLIERIIREWLEQWAEQRPS
jgi:predicted transcriptional regulator